MLRKIDAFRRFGLQAIGPALLAVLIAARSASPEVFPGGFKERNEQAVEQLRADPRLKDLPSEKLVASGRFFAGNVLFVLLHEMGHALIDDMYLYVLGREEDAADSFATVTMLKLGGAFSQRVLESAAKGWFYSDTAARAQGQKLAFYDAHGLDLQRAYQIICLMVGSDPARFERLANETKLPEDRQGTCLGDYNTAEWGWNKALEPHRRPPARPSTEIRIVYGPADDKNLLDLYARHLRSIGILEFVADYAAREFAWSAPWTISAQTCGESGARWNHPTRTLVLCYEIAAEFAQLFHAYSPEWTASPNLPKESR